MDKLQRMERILINGEWYVKESKEDVNIDFTFTNSCIVETDKFCFEAIRCMRDDNKSYYPDISIDVTKKEGDMSDLTKEYWDNPSFFKGLLNRDNQCIEDLSDFVEDSYNQQVFLKMLEKLNEIGWI